MAKDERIFRVTKQGYRRTTTQYKSRTAISAMFASTGYGSGGRRPDILKVEAIDPADIEWADVTDEFRNKPAPKCGWHTTYTGVRKPTIWGWNPEDVRKYWTACTCAALYLEKHPEYETHDVLCSMVNTDPAACPCQILKKVLE